MNWQTPLTLLAAVAAGLTMAGSGIAGDAAPPPRADGRIAGSIELHSDGRVVRLSPQGERKGPPVGQPATTVPAVATGAGQPHRAGRPTRPLAP